MERIPDVLATRQDWKNAALWAASHGGFHIVELRRRFLALLAAKTVKKLKADATPTIDPITGENTWLPSDYEDVVDASAPFQRSGLTTADIAEIKERLGITTGGDE